MIRAVLTDIEGTTSSVSFVKDVLFPYARRSLRAFVGAHRQEARVRDVLDETRRIDGRRDLDEAAVVDLLCQWIDEDRKVTPLKTLQGYLWEDGYRGRSFVGHVYDDAAVALRRWRRAGLALYVFSSGSVDAQRLLFEHASQGDLRAWFAGFFDTTTGPKREASSYDAIARASGLLPEEMLFLSDTSQELDAACSAGMATTWVNRDGQASGSIAHREARSFDDIDPTAFDGASA